MSQDAVVIMRAMELAVLYVTFVPHSSEMLQKIAEDYKSKLEVLEKGHSEATTAWMAELAKAHNDLADSAKALADKDATLKDRSLQYALLSRTLYGVSLSSTVK